MKGYESSFKKYEIARTKNLSKAMTLGNLEEIITELFDEIQLAYDQPKHLTAKIIIRAIKDKNALGIRESLF